MSWAAHMQPDMGFNTAAGQGCQQHFGALGSRPAAAGHAPWPVGQRDVCVFPSRRLVPSPSLGPGAAAVFVAQRLGLV